MTAIARTLDIDWATLHRDAVTLAQRLPRERSWRGLVAISRGGMVPAAIIACELGVRLIDTLCVASYQGRQQQTGEILKGVMDTLREQDGDGVLVVDDLVDTGQTGRLVRAHLPKAYYATIYAKPKGAPFADLFLKVIPQDVWLVFPWDVAPEAEPDALPEETQ